MTGENYIVSDGQQIIIWQPPHNIWRLFLIYLAPATSLLSGGRQIKKCKSSRRLPDYYTIYVAAKGEHRSPKQQWQNSQIENIFLKIAR